MCFIDNSYIKNFTFSHLFNNMNVCVYYTQNYVQFVHRHRADFLSRVDVIAVHMIIWFRPLEVSLGELSVQRCCGSAQRCRTDGQMWTDRPTDPWLIVHLSAPAAESLGRSTVLCCSSIFPSLISHAFALSFPYPFYFFLLFCQFVILLIYACIMFATRN